MTEQTPILARHDLEAKIVRKCWENDAFRKEFTADPAAAFSKYLNMPPSGLPRIVVHEESAGSWHIVLPARPANADELSERDLEQIAGGASPLILSATTALTIGLGVSGSASASAIVSLDRGW